MSIESRPLFALLLGGLFAFSPGFGLGQKHVDYLQVVKQATPSIVLTSSSNPALVSTPVTFTAALIGSGATPSGLLTFLDGATPLSTSMLNGSGVATFSTSSLAIGPHSITAWYGGEANYLPAQSATLMFSVVNPPPVVLTPASPSITTAQGLAVTVAVGGQTGKPLPTGTVVLSSASYISAPAVLANGSATITIPGGSLPAGTVPLTVSYTPDATSAASYSSSSGSVSVTVTPGPQTGYFMLSHNGSITVNPGATSGNTVTITVTPSAGFTGQVNLACSVTTSIANPTDLPTCTLGSGGTSTSSVVIAGSGAVTTTLAVSTSAAAINAALPARTFLPGGRGSVLACLLFLVIPLGRGKWRRILGMLLLLLAVAGGMAGCGGGFVKGNSGNGNSGTSPGVYTVTVSGTSGTTTVTTVVNVTVQ